MPSSNLSPWFTEGIEDSVLEVLQSLGINEVELEVSQIYLPALVELASAGKVMPVDRRDAPGGFGGVDLWVATVVPALAAALGAQRSGCAGSEVEAAIREVVGRVGSPRAERQAAELIRVIEAATARFGPARQ